MRYDEEGGGDDCKRTRKDLKRIKKIKIDNIDKNIE